MTNNNGTLVIKLQNRTSMINDCYKILNNTDDAGNLTHKNIDYTLITLLVVFLIVSILIFITINNIICCFCRLFKRNKNKAKNNKNETINNSNVNNHMITSSINSLPFFNSNDPKTVNYYGINDEDSNEVNVNVNKINELPQSSSSSFSSDDRAVARKKDRQSKLNSFRAKSSSPQPQSKYRGIHELLKDPLTELEMIEKSISKSLSELNEKYRQITCIEVDELEDFSSNSESILNSNQNDNTQSQLELNQETENGHLINEDSHLLNENGNDQNDSKS